MKKIIKVLLILVVVIGVTVAGLYFGYNYNKSKKVAEVVKLDDGIAMTEYWGDDIQSYGQVTSEKAQTCYVPAGTEIRSVNVKEGDHVNAGDVIISVKKESKDIVDKELQLEKAKQAYKVSQVKLDRLMNMTPSPDPENVSSNDDTREYEYVSSVDYVAKKEFDSGYGGVYKKDDVVATESFDINGKSTDMTYYLYDHHGTGEDSVTTKSSISKDEYKGKDLSDDEFIGTQSNTSVHSYIRRTYYYDSEQQKVVGEIVYDINGDVEYEQKVPTGLSAKQISEDTETLQAQMKKQDLEIRKMENEYETIVNSKDNGDIVAKVSGTVSKVQDKDNFNKNQPFFIITATDEYYISGSIGEFYLDKINVGDTVSINSWETGQTAEAVITSISDTPNTEENYFYSGGNSNTSNYEFKATFDKSAGIEIGTAVDITMNPEEEGQSGLYIPDYLIKKDASGSYVMKMNEAGVLEKTYIKIGKKVWGDMTQVKDGITIDDSLAFPYGVGAIEGIKCKQVDYFEDGMGGLG
ncbi:Biotin-lipoyl like [Pseudobutyrivibrio sp. YE44]|uniref:HlyD family efflux transporter periplasmic adaptor subunit n=1 Tax=Pseudobutyrivibrio sp. YE44 TaxID=1520802 RepID=UPI00087E9065|nr:HlyD family efflux transporter periplasmic adaptor subunit [Pseudobutyrivibrio sp. YE44]SDB13077.1 Biotin-lipoyl like [Pseudobutyrivibrio sp. YE44]